MVADVRDPRDIKGTMSEFLNGEGLRELGELLRIKEAWNRIVGEENAHISKPYRLEAGKLFIGVGSHAQVQNLMFHGEEIKRAIKEEIGLEIEGVTARKINLK